MNARLPKRFDLDNGQPHPIELIRDLREVLGLPSGALPITPQQAWEEAINEVAHVMSGHSHTPEAAT